MNNILKNGIVRTLAMDTTGAPSSTDGIQGAVLDLAGYDAVLYVAQIDSADPSTGGLVKLWCQGASSSESTSVNAGGCTGASFIAETTAGTAGVCLALDVQSPKYRYNTGYVYRDGTNAARINLLAIPYQAKYGPTSPATTEVHESIVVVTPTT